MEQIFTQTVTVQPQDLNPAGNFKLSSLLYYVQEASGGHCRQLGCDWDTLAEKEMFWAVLRHRVVIHRLPQPGQTLTVQTWPLPTTRVAYPRAVQALDEEGNVLFEAMSLWVLMDRQTRAMILPAKSGIEVPGVVRGTEIANPASLAPQTYGQHCLWEVAEADLDKNRHVNNTIYLDRAEQLTGAFGSSRCPREFTVCYLAEARLGQLLTLSWAGSDGDVLTLEATRPRPGENEKAERVFAAKLVFEPGVL